MCRTLLMVVVAVTFILNPLLTTESIIYGAHLSEALSQDIQQPTPSNTPPLNLQGESDNVSTDRYISNDLRSANGILYSQTDSPGSLGIPSQVFFGEYSSFDSKAADDFTIPESDGMWIINSIEVAGSYSEGGGPVESVNIAFFEDNSGQPGTLVYEEKGRQDNDTNRDGYLEIPLVESLTLEHGTYWLSIQASMNYATKGQWYWTSRTALSGHPLAWQNPGDGFESGCVSWQPGEQCNISTASEPDALFLLRGITESSVTPEDENISFSSYWLSSEPAWTHSVAWGDVDGDGDLDLAVGDDAKPIRLYRNDGGVLTSTAVWSSSEIGVAVEVAVAWGDVDSDGDLDLAVGHYKTNRLYRNDNGVLTSSAVWYSSETEWIDSVAWGDVDGDGDLDLAAGTSETIRLYRNDDSVLTSTAVWASSDGAGAASIAWGDVDGDGDLDLAVGNHRASQLYRNNDGVLNSTAVWVSSEDNGGRSVAWGDVDSDGDLDLAVGSSPIRLYRNDGGVLTSTAVWNSIHNDTTYSIAWGDVDGDGDLDLAAGNANEPNRLYRNDGGVLTFNAVWSSSHGDSTRSIAWGDVDGDGDLDLAMGNAIEPNRLYRNDGEMLTSTAIWSSSEDDGVSSVAWGDVDGDGDLDLAVGSSPNRLYRNEEGTLISTAVWFSSEDGWASSIAWGDVDGDGDLDLATGYSYAPNRLYRNDGGVLTSVAVWSSSEDDATTSVAWGDVDGDGDLDLAVGNSDEFGAPDRLYRNDGGMLTSTPVWSSSEADWTASIAWGDVDGDGDLDLATGNHSLGYAIRDEGGVPVRLYHNDGGALTSTAVWSSSESDHTECVAWGDVDGDGDLDLAVGNDSASNRLYRNDEGELTSTAVWSSAEFDTTCVAWGDIDSDGDLDLAAGRSGPNRLHRNDDGVLTPTAVWSSSEDDPTGAFAWGDVDSDGDLDLAAGSSRNPIRLYRNKSPIDIQTVNDPSYVVIQRPGGTDSADFFSTSQIVNATTVSVEYDLFDPEGDSVLRIFPEFSPNGGGQWLPATPGSGGDGLVDLTASPDGMPHTFMWHAEADLIKSDNVVFRIRVLPGFTHSPILWAAVDGKSLPFRVEAAQYVKVVDESGNAAAGATVYVDGQFVGTTERVGLLNPDEMADGTPIVALLQKAEHPTVRAAHDGWAYRTYVTTLPLDSSGQVTPFAVSGQGEQRLVLYPDAPVILFNIVVSVEWDADESYLSMLEDAFGKASDYLYDVTDGQMAFGQVAIYDNAEHWSDADFQISAKNTVRPYAYIGGIDSDDTSHAIRVGRFWSGSSGNEGNWNEPDGYRTLIHEFGHYALYLHDEYFVRTTDSDGRFTGRQSAACTGLSIISDEEQAGNGSVMYYQYKASELVDSDRWTANCQKTEQHRVNGKSDWETVLDHYGSEGMTLSTPSSRGSIMDGPSEFPHHLLPFPEITIHNRGIIQDDAASRNVTVMNAQGQPVSNALVALFTTPNEQTVAIDQGLTDTTGQITVYGASKEDRIQAASFDGSMAGVTNVGDKNAIELVLEPVSVSAASVSGGQSSPHLSMTPSSDGTGLTIQVNGVAQSSLPLNAFLAPAEGGGSPQSTILAHSPGTGAYDGVVSLDGVGLGTGKIQISGGKLAIPIISDYNLQRVIHNQANSLYSEDGNVAIHMPPNSLSGGADGYATILPIGYVPGPLPESKTVIGSGYEARLSSANILTKNMLVELTYHRNVVGNINSPDIYHWDTVNKSWLLITGSQDSDNSQVTAATNRQGIFVLMGQESARHQVYLPTVMN